MKTSLLLSFLAGITAALTATNARASELEIHFENLRLPDRKIDIRDTIQAKLGKPLPSRINRRIVFSEGTVLADYDDLWYPYDSVADRRNLTAAAFPTTKDYCVLDVRYETVDWGAGFKAKAYELGTVLRFGTRVLPGFGLQDTEYRRGALTGTIHVRFDDDLDILSSDGATARDGIEKSLGGTEVRVKTSGIECEARVPAEESARANLKDVVERAFGAQVRVKSR